jgi:hypothetical protein
VSWCDNELPQFQPHNLWWKLGNVGNCCGTFISAVALTGSCVLRTTALQVFTTLIAVKKKLSASSFDLCDLLAANRRSVLNDRMQNFVEQGLLNGLRWK